jgi:hypothetical protein
MGEYDERGEMWLVPLHQPEFYICLRKLGMSDEKFEVWKNLYNKKVFQKDINYNPNIGVDHIVVEKSKKGTFTWSVANQWFNKEDNASFKYMGLMVVSSEEVKEYYDDIEMRDNANKYNL